MPGTQLPRSSLLHGGVSRTYQSRMPGPGCSASPTGSWQTSVEAPAGEAELRVYIVPSAQRDTLAIPMGRGHMFFTRYAEGRGINVLDLVDPLTDSETGSLAYAATRARIETASGKNRFAKMEGAVKAEAPEEYPIVRVTPNPA